MGDNRMRYLSDFLAAAALMTVPAAARDVDCSGAQSTRFEIDVCTGGAAATADREMNNPWYILKPVADNRGDVLLAHRKMWLAYREVACTAGRGSFGKDSLRPRRGLCALKA